MSLSDLVNSYASRDNRLNYNATVKDQVQNIQTNIDNFRRVLDSQKKQQGEIQYSIKKLEEETKTNFHELHKELSQRINYLTQAFKSDCKAQNKQFQYLQMQNSTLSQQHQRLNQLASVVTSRAGQVQNNVGL